MFEREVIRRGRCEGCKFVKLINAQNDWKFYACYCKPYRGKWVAEIKDCPKEADNDTN